jgi:hypothetical protein
MRKNGMVLFLCCFILVARWSPSHAQVVNGDFSNGLTGWISGGNVQVLVQEARVGDTTDAFLFQGVSLSQGNYTIDFDFRNSLSPIVPLGNFPDTFFASLYFTNQIHQFNLQQGTGFEAALALFDMDRSGVSNVNPSGIIGPSPKGAGSSHFSMTFQNLHGHVIPVFELFAENGINGDSATLLDNITITAGLPVIAVIPALSDGAALVFGLSMGILALLFLRKMRKV